MASFELNGEAEPKYAFDDSVLGKSLKKVTGVFVFPCSNLKSLSYALSGESDILKNPLTDKTKQAKMVYRVPTEPAAYPIGFGLRNPDFFDGLAIPLTIASNKSDTIKEMRVVLEDNNGCPDPICAIQIRFDLEGPWTTMNTAGGLSTIVKFVKSLN